MQIKTKYEIGDRIWIIYSNKEEVHLYSDEITNIDISKKEIVYITKETYEEIKEDDIILITELDKLLSKIKLLDFENSKQIEE